VGRAISSGDRAADPVHLGLVTLPGARLVSQLWPGSPLSQPAPDQARVIVGLADSVDDGPARGVLDRDLIASLRGLSLELPPLRDHAEDIPLLVTHFQREVGGRSGRAGSGFTVAALEALAWYSWPGNVGELRVRSFA
jgi:DNA-binding NtrC family response regulator